MATRADAEAFLSAMMERFHTLQPISDNDSFRLVVRLLEGGPCMDYVFAAAPEERDASPTKEACPVLLYDPGDLKSEIHPRPRLEVRGRPELVEALTSEDPLERAKGYIMLGQERGFERLDVDHDEGGCPYRETDWETIRSELREGPGHPFEVIRQDEQHRIRIDRETGEVRLDWFEAEADVDFIDPDPEETWFWYVVDLSRLVPILTEPGAPEHVAALFGATSSSRFTRAQIWGRHFPGTFYGPGLLGEGATYFATYTELLDALIPVFERLAELQPARPNPPRADRLRAELVALGDRT